MSVHILSAPYGNSFGTDGMCSKLEKTLTVFEDACFQSSLEKSGCNPSDPHQASWPSGSKPQKQERL